LYLTIILPHSRSPHLSTLIKMVDSTQHTSEGSTAHDSTASSVDQLRSIHSPSKAPFQHRIEPLLRPTEVSRTTIDTTTPFLPHQGSPPSKSRKGDGTKDPDHIHWLSPTIMISCLIGGACFAVGHHFYYHSLGGHIVGTVSDQQWALRCVKPATNSYIFIVKCCNTLTLIVLATAWPR
jgi:hypothetical protein